MNLENYNCPKINFLGGDLIYEDFYDFIYDVIVPDWCVDMNVEITMQLYIEMRNGDNYYTLNIFPLNKW